MVHEMALVKLLTTLTSFGPVVAWVEKMEHNSFVANKKKEK